VTATDYKRLTSLTAHSRSNACFLLDAKIAHFMFTNKVRCVPANYVREQHLSLCITCPEMWVFAHTRLAIVSRPLMPC